MLFKEKGHKFTSFVTFIFAGHAPKATRNLGLPTSHLESRTQELKKRLTNSCARVGRRSMFKNMEFLVTGFSRQREKKLEDLIKNYGGIVLSDIPPPSVYRGQRLKSQAVPVVLCSKKVGHCLLLFWHFNSYLLN